MAYTVFTMIKDKEEIKVNIEAQIAKTKKAILSYESNTQPISPENSIGRVSRMDAINNKGVAEAALRTAKQKLSRLQSALQNIDDPDFGKCSRCARDIPWQRVILMPQSPYCVRCAR